MKTLDEALDTISSGKKSRAEIYAEFDRFKTLMSELCSSDRVRSYVASEILCSWKCDHAIQDTAASGDIDPVFQACMRCYVTGVKIGMEMEKP